MFLVRAGRDRWPEILSSLDHFNSFALEQNLRVTMRNYPEGQHAFDALDDTAETRSIIRQTLTFLTEHLARE
jgi:acetyl esterase/lipase